MGKPTIGIIGRGHVGSALQRGAARAGYEVRGAGHEAGEVRAVSAWGELLMLAVPFTAIGATVQEIGGGADGKILVDATNALTADYQWAIGFSTSGAEELQKKLPRARVVKAFNTVFAAQMETGRTNGEQLTTFVAGDDAAAKEVVLGLAREIGFDAVDAGPLRNARMLEPLAFLNIQLGNVLKMGKETGFRYVH